MEDRQRLTELTGTNRPTQTTTPLNTTHLACVRMPGVSDTACARRPLYGPHPTQPHTSTHTQRVVSGQPRQPDNRITVTTIKTAHALPVQSSRWSQRQGNARHPSRTRKLSLTAPMVLHPPGCGRVGHHRAHTTQLAREPPTTAAPGQLLYTPTNKTTTHKQQKPGWIQDRSDIGVRNGAPLSP